MSATMVTWAELRRDAETLLVPYMAWFSVCLATAEEAPDEAVWDEAAGVWRVSAASAAVFADAMGKRSPSGFEVSFGCADLGPGVSSTVGIAALAPAAAAQAKVDAEAFLRRGAFTWRCVCIQGELAERPAGGPSVRARRRASEDH